MLPLLFISNPGKRRNAVKSYRKRFLWGVACIIFLSVLVSPLALAGEDFDEMVSIALDGSRTIDYRIMAIKKLGASDNEQAVDPLIVLLKDPREQRAIRSSAVRALAQLGEPRGEIIKALEGTYREPDTDSNLSYTILLYLGYMHATESLPLLSEALSHSNSMIRFKAAQALGMLQSDKAIDALVSHLGNEADPMVRAQMVQAIGQTQNSVTEAALIKALRSDQEPLVRLNAAIMLGEFTTLSPEACSALEAAQDDASPSVRTKVKGILQ